MSNYIDIPSIIQVIGCIYNNNDLLDNEKYHFNEEDFPNEFHRIIFGCIYNLHALGAKEITPIAIEDYLEQRPQKLAIYKTNKGLEWLKDIKDSAQLSAFDYYYNRMKKMTLLRMYDKAGIDLTWLYDINNILDIKKKQAQEDWIDNHSLNEIAEKIDNRISDIKAKYIDNYDGNSVNAGDGAIDLLNKLKETPEVGVPLFGKLNNTVTRGARLKKFYLRSAATGVGKTRAMIADACYIACDECYDVEKREWIKNGTAEPTIYISTEQEKEELQTMMLAFLSGVDEDHMLYGQYGHGEWERIEHAAEILKRNPLYIQQLPDFSLADIENTIKHNIKEHGCRYCFFDYIHSSMKILSEISGKSGVKGLREDNILFMVSIRLKDLCNEYGVFILTSTQLNMSYQDSNTPDQNLLRGAKSIADKIDLGEIMLETTEEDKEILQPIVEKLGCEMPAIKISVYKNRRGRWKGIYLWCKANRGICRIEPIFVTKWNYELVPMDDLQIDVKQRMDSAF